MRIVAQMEHSHPSNEPRAEKLIEETLIAIICPDVAQYFHCITGSGNIRKPLMVFIVGAGNNALDILHHCKAQRIGVEARKIGMVKIRLKNHVRVRLQEFEKVSVGNSALLVQAGHDTVVNERRGALVHDFDLSLRIKILRQVAHDSQQLSLPGQETRRGLFEKIKQVFLWQLEQGPSPFAVQRGHALEWASRD